MAGKDMEQLRRLRTCLDEASRRLQRVRAQHINTKRDRKYFEDLVGEYFRERLAAPKGDPRAEKTVAALDSKMQALLSCTRGRTLAGKYRRLVRECQNLVNDLYSSAIQQGETHGKDGVFGAKERKILSALDEMKLSAAASSYKQGLYDLGAESRWSWRGTILEFREALRETLDAMAPDEEVQKDPRFRLKAGAHRPTMRQKALFVLKSRRRASPQAKSVADAVTRVEETIAALVRSAYDRASYGVHNQVTRGEAVRIKEYVTLALGELLEIGE